MYIHPPEILVLGFGREEPSHLGMEKISARFARRNMKAVATMPAHLINAPNKKKYI